MPGTTTRTTVGFSGSGASRRAVRWAVHDCAATGNPLHVLLALGAAAGPGDLDALLADELLRVPGREPGVDVTVTTADAVSALLDEAASSAVLVLGCGRRVAPVGAGTGKVLQRVVPRAPVPLVLVGPQAVIRAPKRVVVVSAVDADADEGVASWVLGRGGDLPVQLLTTWWPWSTTNPPAAAEREHAEAAAAERHRVARARLVTGRGPVRAELVEGFAGEVVPQRLTVGDLVVVAAATLPELPVRTLRSPVVLVPPAGRRAGTPATDGAVDLRGRTREGARRG